MKTRPIDVLNLAAPHTWASTSMPALLSAVWGYHVTGQIDIPMAICVTLAVLLMQSAANAFDDCSDFMKGTDKLENSPDPTDAVIVHGMDIEAAKAWAFVFLFAALIPGAFVIIRRGVIPLIIGVLGALILLAYPLGPHSLNTLPGLGEFFAGFTLGGLVPLAGVFAQTGTFSFMPLLAAIPQMLGIAIINNTNNGSDIVRDRASGRHTLACVLGQEKTDRLYRILLVIWVLCPIVLLWTLVSFRGVLVYLIGAVSFMSVFMHQYKLQLGPENRADAMNNINVLYSLLGLSYMAGILAGA